MPTGSGKTGIIAILTRDCAEVRRSLVLAPRVAIRDQLERHIRHQFFATIGHSVPPRSVERLTEARIQAVAAAGSDVVFVATIQQIDRLRKKEPEVYAVLGELLGLVVMDEGHYEPAPSWSVTIRGLGKPVLLLTATPYRNDLKSFQIDEGAIATLRFDDAVAQRIIRDVEFIDRPAQSRPAPFARDVIDEFERLVPAAERGAARIIVRCESKENIDKICVAFGHHGYRALGIHEGFSDDDAHLGRRRTVPDPSTDAAQVWVHQFKLLEGVDDARFRLVAFFDRLGSVRSLVQQVGRVLRNPGRAAVKAYVLDHHAPRHHRMWEQFRAFDRTIRASSLASPLAVRVADALINGMGALEYVDREVRTRFTLAGIGDPRTEFQLRKEVHLLRKGVPRPLVQIRKWIQSQLNEQDCTFRTFDIDAETFVAVYIRVGNSSLLVDTYFLEPRLELIVVREFGDLVAFFDSGGSVPLNEPKAGLDGAMNGKSLRRLINPAGDSRVSAVSTRNTAPAASAIRTRSVTAASIEDSAAFFDDFQHAVTSVIGYSDEHPRARAAGPDADADAGADAEARRRLLEVRRYIGFTRGRLSEAGPAVPLGEYLAWLDAIAAIVGNSRRRGLALFSRYCAQLPGPPADTTPRNILIDFSEACDIFVTFSPDDDKDVKALEVEDSCQDCDPVAGEPDVWSFYLNANGQQALVKIRYDRARGGYVLESDDMTERYRSGTARVREDVISFLNRRQLFNIVTGTPKVVYLHGGFFESDVVHGDDFRPDTFQVGRVLEPLQALRHATSEKGTACLPGGAGWEAGSVFALIDGLVAGSPGRAKLVRDVKEAMSLVCDDLNKEVADFVLCDWGGRRVVAIHAKASSTWSPFSASSLQEVCAQAMKNAGFLSMFAPVKPPNLARWETPWKASKVTGSVLKRIRLGLPGRQAHWDYLEERIRDPATRREVWLFLGSMLSKNALETELAKAKPRAESFHVVHLLQTTMATVGSMGASLRVFCSR